MAKILRHTEFGDPVLRQTARRLSSEEILSDRIQEFIDDLSYTLVKKKYGVGLAAPQVGESVAILAVGIKPTPSRPNLERFDMIVINPVITETFGNRTGMWEGCISCGSGSGGLFAKAPRYKKIRLEWMDKNAQKHDRVFEGFTAHVLQHETDHLNGILFVDRVRDTKTYMTTREYKKRVAKSKTK